MSVMGCETLCGNGPIADVVLLRGEVVVDASDVMCF